MKKILLSLFLTSFCLWCFSCKNNETIYSVEINLDYDANVYYLENNMIKTLELKSTIHEDLSQDLQEKNHKKKNSTIIYCKNNLTPILIEPLNVFNNDITGMIYPIINKEDIYGGFCAKVFIRLFLQSNEKKEDILSFCKYFNWNRLYNELSKYSPNQINKINMDKILTDIAAKNFTIYSIQLQK